MLFDTSGYERNNSLPKIYFKGAHAVLFVFSFDNKSSFDNIIKWIRLYDESVNDSIEIPRYLIGNKCDLENNIEQSLIDELSQKNNLKYISTSAKLNISINELFNEIAEKFYDNYDEYQKSLPEWGVALDDYRRRERLRHGKGCFSVYQ